MNAKTMTGPRLAALRHRLGWSTNELAKQLDVNPRTVRAWNSGRDPVPVGVMLELDELLIEHELDVHNSLQTGRLEIPYAHESTPWWVAVADSASRLNPEIDLVWRYDTFRPQVDTTRHN